MSPTVTAERYQTLDLLRGFALFGVLIVNLLSFFRVSLFEVIPHFHTDPGWANHAVDILVAEFLEFKAFGILSLTFGIGIAVQFERATRRGARAELFLVRRFAVLLLFGICHMVLISNVDILILYAVCGIAIVPLLRLPGVALATLGLAAIYSPSVFPGLQMIPPVAVMQAHAEQATQIYRHGGFFTILAFRWRETREFIAPLLIGSAQQTAGMMLIGAALWRSGIVRNAPRFHTTLRVFCAVAGGVGLLNTTVEVWKSSVGERLPIPVGFARLGSNVPMALSYAAAVLAMNPKPFLAPVAALGRMALTSYLTQSILFSLIFYGFGLGLMGTLAPAVTAAFGLLLYIAQMAASVWWLRRYRFGPLEWLWRSMTYGSRPPLRVTHDPAVLI